MKRRFAARRNRQKLKVARMRVARRASDPTKELKTCTRGARNMIKARIARGRGHSITTARREGSNRNDGEKVLWSCFSSCNKNGTSCKTKRIETSDIKKQKTHEGEKI